MPFFEQFQVILELFLNVLELIALIVSVFTFFFLMLNKYSKALKKILAPCGLGFWPRMRVLFICRKSQSKKRAFIEYAILRTQGYPVINSEWHSIINAFKTFYSSAEFGDLKYTVPNCTSLIDSSFSQATERYFKYFSTPQARKVFGIQESNFPWVIKIHIEEAYATPTCLLTGLLSQYDENWEAFIKRYVSTAYTSESGENEENDILSNELYFTFAWLLWGPSYEIEYQKYWAGLCQLSYGDESNSVPAIADVDSDVAEKLKDKFLINDEHRYGALISADLSVYEKKPFYRNLHTIINPENAYFYEKIEDGDFSFALKIENFSPCVNYKSKKYYSTAYVWALFELESEDYEFKPGKSVAFFEHANLANKGTYQFLVETLIDKCVKHFESIYKNEENRNRKYRFVCAMNKRIENACIARIKEIMASNTEFGNILKENVILEKKYTPAKVFSAYDEFFAPSNNLKYVEVSLSNQASLSLLAQFYTDIYMPAFPDENERETFDGFIKYLKNATQASEYKYHIILAKDENERVVGGSVFNYFNKTNTGVIEFIAVKADLQSGGIGSLIYNHVLSILSADSYSACKKTVDFVCCEIDSPEYSRAEVKKYLYFWDKNNFRHLNFDYVQPALSADQQPVSGLWLTLSSQKTRVKQVPGQLVLDIIYDYMRFCMGISDPQTNEQYIAMKEQIDQKGDIELLKIV